MLVSQILFSCLIILLSVASITIAKKSIPGVGKYQTTDTYKKLAKSITSLRMRRH